MGPAGHGTRNREQDTISRLVSASFFDDDDDDDDEFM